jgi:hypothetical protein
VKLCLSSRIGSVVFGSFHINQMLLSQSQIFCVTELENTVDPSACPGKVLGKIWENTEGGLNFMQPSAKLVYYFDLFRLDTSETAFRRF